LNNQIFIKSAPDTIVSYSSFPLTTLKVCALMLFLLATSGFSIAPEQQANPAEYHIVDEDAAGLNGDLSTDIRALSAYKNTIARMLREGEFQELDSLADQTRSGKERFPGGAWKIHVLYEGLHTPVPYPMHATEEDWSKLLQRLQDWVAARPESVTARIALASTYLDYAHVARGDGYSNTVSESGWKLFEERTTEAKRILDEAAALPTKCPEWYVAMQRVSVNQGWDVTDARVLFEKATKFEPGYYTYARDLAYYLLPKWSGEAGDTEKFVQEAADRIGGDQGDAFYFQVAAADYIICGCEDDPHLSWERIVRGFDASEKLYGTSMLNLNLIAFLASHYGDRDPVIADKALTRIGEQWDESTWRRKEDFESMKEWTAGTAPIVAKNRAIEAAAEANIKTPEGLRYKASFEKRYRELVQQCVKTAGTSFDKFETLTSVGANGTVDDMKIYWNGFAAVCVYQTLRTAQQQKTSLFPAPPQVPYWIRLDLDAGEFTPVASK
jgi:hypothetical protein